MPSIGVTQLFSATGTPGSDGNVLLYTTLAFALTSFLCSTYTTLRTLLPLLAAHPLSRRREGIAVGAPASKRVRLKSAQRFTTYLAICDILSACILVWEAAAAATLTTGLGGTKAGASRLYLACTARPTLLLVVAVLSYANVVQGRSIALGKIDWIVWAPALGIFILGAGLASLAPVGGLAVWVGLVVWLSATTAVVSICFGRLLIAILRVRKTTAQEEKAASPFAHEQDRVVGRHGSSVMHTIASYLPPFHSNFSGLSTSFIGTVGRSTSTLDLPSTNADNSQNILTFTSSSAPAVGYAPSARTSMDSDHTTLRNIRSPTPGSTMGLLAGLRQSISNVSPRPYTPDGRVTPTASARYSVGSQEHEVITFEEVDLSEPRPSMGSYTSSNFHAGGFVGGTAMRQAIVQEVWGSSPAPGTGHRSPQVELSKKEARGALVRIGGHLFGCLLGYALVTPFAFIRLANPSSTPPLIAAILLVIGVSQPGFVLAIQCWTSEGFWYRTESPPVLTSSSAANLEILVEGQPEMVERPGSAASSYFAYEKSHATLPGIQPGGEDAVETRMGGVGRALSMVHTHPKLMILPNGTSHTSSTSGAKTSQGHARLRSLTLGKTVFGADLDEDTKGRKRSGSVASRKTFAGFELRSMSPIPFHRDDEAITRSMLATTKQRPLSFADTGRIPFGFSHATNGASRSTPEFSHKKDMPAPTPSPSTPDFAFRTEDLTLANSFDTGAPHTKKRAPSSPPDYSIDFLSSQVLPRLVPSVVVGRSTIVEAEDAPLNRRRSSIGTANEITSMNELGLGDPSTRPTRNIRNLSLPNLLQGGSFSSRRSTRRQKSAEDVWVAVEEDSTIIPSPIVERAKTKTPESVIASIASRVRSGGIMTTSNTEDKSLRRRSWKDRSTKAWEEREKVEGVPSSASVDLVEKKDDVAYLRPPGSARRGSGGWGLDSPAVGDETEILEEEGNVADEEEESDDEEAERELEAHRRRRSVSPMSLPTSPIHEEWQQLDQSIVLRGSQFIDEEDDGEVGTVHCATIRPVRGSDTSDIDSTSHYSLRPTHIQTGSLSSNRSLTTSASGITSEGFRNVLETGSWHARDESNTGAFTSSDSEPSSANEAHSTRRASSGLRPLSLLSQRANADRTSFASSASDASDCEREMRKVARHQTAVQASSRAPNSHGVPLPPIPMPPTIEEADEGKSSGTPTPRTARQRSASTPRAASAHMPMCSTPPPPPPSRTPPQITTRSRARREQHRRARVIPSMPADENVRPLATTQPLRIATRSAGAGGGGSKMRGLR